MPEDKTGSECDSQDGEPLKYESDPEVLSAPSEHPALWLPMPSALPPGLPVTVRMVSQVPTHNPCATWPKLTGCQVAVPLLETLPSEEHRKTPICCVLSAVGRYADRPPLRK